MCLDVPRADVDKWLAELKPYQRDTLRVYLANTTPEEAARKWIETTGSPNIIAFGGVRDTKPFWDNLKKEFRRFLCDGVAYVDVKKALGAEGPITRALLISHISYGLANQIGYAAPLLAPAIAMMLCAVGQISVTAYCREEEKSP